MLVPATREAYDLLQKGSVLMAAFSRRGMRVDTAYLDRAITDTDKEIAAARERMAGSEVQRVWEKHYGSSIKPNSHEQLGRVIFDILGHPRNPLCQDSNDKAAFKHVKLPFVKDWFEAQTLDKAKGTFLFGIRKEVIDGRIHPDFPMNFVESYRSSSRSPNFQNQPRRNKRIAKAVRACIIPSKPGWVFTNFDYSSQEVRSSCFYHHDPAFETYVLGGGDMHADSAQDVYCLSDSEFGPSDQYPGKAARDATKNKFVFPGFYGSFYPLMTPDLWDMIDELDLQTAQGVPMIEHLRRKGIKARGACDPEKEPLPNTFEAHIRKCQDLFWKRFPVYDQWKRDWWDLYQSQGGVNTLSGFRLAGVFRRNQVLCNANQGTAFHCLLWTGIKANDEMLRRKMLSRIVLQIHDSVMTDGPKSEQGDVTELLRRIGTVEIRKHWKWISVPLACDFEGSETNWSELTKIKVAA